MRIEQIEAVGPPNVIDGPWWSGTVDRATPVFVDAVAPLERDFRAEALGIAQHGTAYIPSPPVRKARRG